MKLLEGIERREWELRLLSPWEYTKVIDAKYVEKIEAMLLKACKQRNESITDGFATKSDLELIAEYDAELRAEGMKDE
jgi:hypothetical protein